MFLQPPPIVENLELPSIIPLLAPPPIKLLFLALIVLLFPPTIELQAVDILLPAPPPIKLQTPTVEIVFVKPPAIVEVSPDAAF
jgi:hypothetical protein